MNIDSIKKEIAYLEDRVRFLCATRPDERIELGRTMAKAEVWRTVLHHMEEGAACAKIPAIKHIIIHPRHRGNKIHHSYRMNEFLGVCLPKWEESPVCGRILIDDDEQRTWYFDTSDIYKVIDRPTKAGDLVYILPTHKTSFLHVGFMDDQYGDVHRVDEVSESGNIKIGGCYFDREHLVVVEEYNSHGG